MSKFIIVEKDKKGNKCGERYTITYQIEDSDYKRYKVDMFCICEDPPKYCYVADHYGIGLETEKDRAEFLDEFYEFQKGGSYRKTHPIKYKNSELLEQELRRQEENISTLKREIEKAKDQELEDKFTHYLDDVDNQSLDKYISKLKSAIESSQRYKLEGIEYHIWEGHRIFIQDTKLNKRVKVITIKDGKLDIRDLTKYDIK